MLETNGANEVRALLPSTLFQPALAARVKAAAITGEKHIDGFVDMDLHLLLAERVFIMRDERQQMVIGHD